MNKTVYKIRFAYEGEILKDGSMDIQDLAPALLAYSKLVKRANEIIRGEDNSVEVKIDANSLHKGSVDITLVLICAANIFTYVQDSGIMQLIEVLGWAKNGGKVIKNIFSFISKFHNEKIDKVKDMGNGNVIINGDNNVIITSAIIPKLFSDSICREQIKDVVAPVNKDGIDSFQVRDQDDLSNKAALVTVDKSNISCFDAIPAETVTTKSEEIELEVKIVSPQFNSNRWKFSSDGKDFNAIIEDNEFLKKVHQGQISFSCGDKMKIQFYKETTKHTSGNEQSKFVITKVWDIIHSGAIEEPSLF